MKISFSLFFFGIILLGCKTQENTSIKNAASKPNVFKIVLGTGGGVSGFYSEFWVNQDGQVIRKNFDSETPKLVKKMEKSQALDLYNKLILTGFSETQLNVTGNINYYIELTCDGKTHKVHWGKPNKVSVPDAIQQYFDTTMNILTTQ